MSPMYFHVFVPQASIGVAFFQSYQALSATTRYLEGLKEFFQNKYSGYTFDFNRAVDKNQLEEYAKSIREISMSVQVLCTMKENRGTYPYGYKVVIGIGGIGVKDDPNGRWFLTESRAIDFIENRGFAFFTNVNGITANVIVVVVNGKKELKTDSDSSTRNNLLSLPDCP